MKYVKPLQLFMEMRKPCTENCARAIIGLTCTARRDVSMYVQRSDKALPNLIGPCLLETQDIVETLLDYQEPLPFFPPDKLLGIVVGKDCVGVPLDILVDNLCKTGKFESLKYTYWENNIMSVGASTDILIDEWCKPIKFKKSKHTERWPKVHETYKERLAFSLKDFSTGFSSFLMLKGYMQFFDTLVESPKEDFICIPKYYGAF